MNNRLWCFITENTAHYPKQISVYAETMDTSVDYIGLSADPESGVAPFETTLKVETTVF